MIRTALLALTLVPAALRAQVVPAPSGVVSHPTSSTAGRERGDSTRHVALPRTAGGRAALRSVAAVLAAVPGLIVGGYVGREILPDPSPGDDPGLQPFINGALVGGSAFAALGASLIDPGDGCRRRDRLRYALPAAAVSAAALLVPANRDGGGAVVVVAFPVAAIVPALAAGLCERRRPATPSR